MVTALNTKENSRHRLRRRLVLEGIAPGGKCVCLPDHLLGQQGDQQFPVQPGFGAVIMVLGQVPQFGDLFESFENQFDLPAEPIPFQHHSSWKSVFRPGSQYHHIFGINQGFRLQFCSLFAGFASEFFHGRSNRCLAFANNAKPCRNGRAVLKRDFYLPNRDLARPLQGFEPFQQRE